MANYLIALISSFVLFITFVLLIVFVANKRNIDSDLKTKTDCLKTLDTAKVGEFCGIWKDGDCLKGTMQTGGKCVKKLDALSIIFLILLVLSTVLTVIFGLLWVKNL